MWKRKNASAETNEGTLSTVSSRLLTLSGRPRRPFRFKQKPPKEASSRRNGIRALLWRFFNSSRFRDAQAKEKSHGNHPWPLCEENKFKKKENQQSIEHLNRNKYRVPFIAVFFLIFLVISEKEIFAGKASKINKQKKCQCDINAIFVIQEGS